MAIDRAIPLPRDPVAWFSGEMERKLRENDNRPGWEGDYLTYLLARARDELDELDERLTSPEPFPGSQADNYPPTQLVEIIREAADVANFVMMIADLAKRALDEMLSDDA